MISENGHAMTSEQKKQARQQRLSRQLRANLQRRKMQARARRGHEDRAPRNSGGDSGKKD